MKLPTTQQIPESADLTEALSDALRDAPLAGPRRIVTREVSAWGSAQGLNLDGDELLSAYNEAAEALPVELRQQLGELAQDAAGRAALIGLLGLTGTSDAVRRLALEALERRLSAEEVGEFARVNLRQRAQVIGAAIKVLAEARTGEALFALAKVYSRRDDDAGEVARSLAERLQRNVPEAVVIGEVTMGLEASRPIADLEPRELLFAVMSLPPRAQWRLGPGERGSGLIERIAPAAVAEDERLRERSKGSAGLHPYEMRLRDELLELVLITGSPEDDDLQKRAAENLFRRESLEEVEALAPYLPLAVLQSYAERSLTTDNRRGARSDRAVLALSAAREREPGLREALRDPAIACLSEKDPELKCEAARLLAVDEQDLHPEAKAALSRAFDELPPKYQRRLAGELHGAGQGRLQHESFLRWVDGARDDEVRARLGALLARWAEDRKTTTAQQAGELIEVFGAGFARVEEADRDALISDLVDVAAGWLHAQRSRIVESAAALTRWHRFRGLVVSRLDRFVELLRADQARGLATDALGLRQETLNAELLAIAAEQPLQEEGLERVLRPVLVDAIRADPRSAGDAFQSASHEGRRRLLAAGLLADSEAKVAAAELEELLSQGTTQALAEKREEVLSALSEAREAAAGNERLAELFAEIGKTIGGPSDQTLVSEVEQSGDRAGSTAYESAGGVESGAPAGVADWRESATLRFPGVVGLPGQELTPTDDLVSHGEELLELLSELDRRAHSKRVAPVADRAHYRADLEAMVDAIIGGAVIRAAGGEGGELIAADGLGESGPKLVELLDGGRPELRSLFWERWMQREGADGPGADLGSALRRSAVQPGDQAALSMLSAAVRDLDFETAEVAATELPTGQMGAAWDACAALLELDLRKERELRDRERSKEKTIGTRMATDFSLPFEVIEHLLFSYFRLRERLAGAGWGRIEDRLGRIRKREQLDPSLHEVRGGEGATRFAVRSLGIKFDGAPITRAVVEAIDGEEQLEAPEEERGNTHG